MTHDEFPQKVTDFSSAQSIEREQKTVDKETRSFEETQQANRPARWDEPGPMPKVTPPKRKPPQEVTGES